MWSIRLAFPLTTKYGDERKPSGRHWEKAQNRFRQKSIFFSSMKHLISIQFSVSKWQTLVFRGLVILTFSCSVLGRLADRETVCLSVRSSLPGNDVFVWLMTISNFMWKHIITGEKSRHTYRSEKANSMCVFLTVCHGFLCFGRRRMVAHFSVQTGVCVCVC